MMKETLHNFFRLLGFDLVRTHNLEAEVERRIRDRERAAGMAFAKLQSMEKVPQKPDGRGEILWTDRDSLMSEAASRILNSNTVLDIGCAFRPQKFTTPRIHICCEPFHEYMERLMVETKGDSKFVYLKLTANQVCQVMPRHSVDTAFLCDVIEHINKEEATSVIAALKEIVRSQIVIFTPLGFMDQDPDADGLDQWGMNGAEWQKHKSGWVPDDFPTSEGWTIVACKDFHVVDGYEREVSTPVGAFWAIWNRQQA